jgi:hypothetical protein
VLTRSIEGGRRDKEALSKIGTIVIEVFRIEYIEDSTDPPPVELPDLTNEVDEKAKKALCTMSVK